MIIAYTDHACRKALYRGITKHEIEYAILAGEASPGRENKTLFNCQEVDVCVVVAQTDQTTYLVVTTYRPSNSQAIGQDSSFVMHV